MSETTVDEGASHAPKAASEPHLGWALAGLSAAAGGIHLAMTPLHAAVGWEESLGFAAAGWFQIIIAGMVLAERAGRRTYQAAVIANLAFIAIWIWSRTLGLPFGDSPGVAEPAGAIDVVTVLLEAGVVLVGLRLLLAPERKPVGKLAPALVAVAALGLATTVIASPDAANHAHGDELTGLDAVREEVNEERCDRAFNHPSYWAEAAYLGVDTEFGNNPPTLEGEESDGGHGGHGGHGSTSTETTDTVPDPNQGRGTAGLDELVSATGLAAESEGAAASLIVALSEAPQEDYDAWLWWLVASGSLEHDHSATVTAEDGSGHGGHVGPQPWVALTDQDECDQLAAEIELARETALAYPTVADAEAAGYQLVTGYVPGIAAHYIKYPLIDGVFEIDEPEMILYDGSDPDSAVVGLSYYLLHPGDNKPTQGFTGDNDHAHRHIGLCSDENGTIIGDSQTTNEECEARGGTKSDGDAGWMSHAWVVPGCESPWGVFSAATPVLDRTLGDATTTDGGACAGSGVRERYAMGEAPTTPEAPKTARGPQDTSGN